LKIRLSFKIYCNRLQTSNLKKTVLAEQKQYLAAFFFLISPDQIIF